MPRAVTFWAAERRGGGEALAASRDLGCGLGDERGFGGGAARGVGQMAEGGASASRWRTGDWSEPGVGCGSTDLRGLKGCRSQAVSGLVPS